MAGDTTTIARPYAEAIFSRATETDKLELWADMLEFLASVASDEAMAAMIAAPKMDRSRTTELMLEVGGGRLSDEGQNLVRLLAENDRLVILPDISSLYLEMKNKHEGTLDVTVAAAFAIKPAQEQQLAEALKAKLGRDVIISTEEDPSLIGGVKITAGDMVIDGSVQGQLTQLANELGI